MHKKYYPEYKEYVYEETLDNGLKVVLLPKNGYSSTYAHFTTKFGGGYANIKVKDTKLISGLAHFLEHRLFDNPKGDVMKLYDNLGAMTNAYTSTDVTTYMFKTSKNLEKCLNLLLDFVQDVNFPEEKVENEKKIISQEYHLVHDNPIRKLLTKLYENIYVNYPARNSTIGTLEDINSTTRELLYTAHSTYYHPKNMTLVLAGGFDPNKIIKLIRNNQKKKTFEDKEIPKLNIEEPYNKVTKEREEVTIGLPYLKIGFGYKFKPFNIKGKREVYKASYILTYLLEMLVGEAAPLTEELLKEKFVLNPLAFTFEIEETVNALFFLADTNDETKITNKLDEILKNAPSYLNEEAFNRIKKALVANYISELDNVSQYAEKNVYAAIYDLNALDAINLIKEIKYEEIVEAAKNLSSFVKTILVFK